MARTAGSLNKSTEQVRRAVAELLTMSAPKMVGWLDKVANGDEVLGVKADPGKAVDLILKAAEYHIPKLARTEHSGEVTQNHTGEIGIRPQLTREQWLALHNGEK